VNCNSFGTINFLPWIAILNPLSSTNAAMSINDCSSDVSLRSAAVASSLLKVPPLARGWSVAISSFPSPPVKLELNALFNTAAAFNLFSVSH
jgi:hypothetical protein